MKDLRLLLIGLIVVAGSILSQTAQDAHAVFHLMRIHAVMGGVNGNANIQYVELRMCSGGQNLVSGHELQFFDAAGTLKATFTFPSNVTNGVLGDSILIATAEYNAASTGPGAGGNGGNADFTFWTTNTVGANGGDPLHPVQSPNGKVTFASGDSDGCDAGAGLNPGDVDSVAYGTAAADFGTAATALPSPSDNRALRESNISGPANNSTDYSLQPTAAIPRMAGGLATDLDTPRNNARQVATLATDHDGDGVPSSTDNCPNVANAAQPDGDGEGMGDACDPCPADEDCDNDSWNDRMEVAFIGTDPLDGCADNAADHAWPADLNNDTFVDVIGDIAFVAANFAVPVPPAPARHNIAPVPPDGFVDIFDILRMAGLFGQGCA